MEKRQMEGIEKLRHENYSYRFIGDALGIPPNTVKSICRRNHFKASGNRKTKAEKQTARVCKNCGTLLAPGGRHGKKFCSDACRREWWKNTEKTDKNRLDSLPHQRVNGHEEETAHESDRNRTKA